MLLKEWEYDNFLKSINNYIGVLIFGTDRGKVSEKSNDLVNQLIINLDNSVDIRELSSEDFLQSKNILQEFAYQKSFFSKLIIIKINIDLIKIDKDFLNFFENLEVSKSNFFILESNYLKNNSPLLNIFKKNNSFVALACYQDTKKSINNTITKYLKQYSLSLDQSSLNYLRDRLGNDSLITKNEIKKIALYARNKKIKLEEILNALGDNSVISLFNLCDSLGNNDLSKFNYFYDKAKQTGANYILILRTLSNHISLLINAKENGFKNINQIKPPVHFSRHDMINKQLASLSLRKLREYIIKIHKLEIQCKINPIISDIIIKKLFL